MKTAFLPAMCLLMPALFPLSVQADELKVWVVPATDHSFEPIDQDSVRIDATVHPDSAGSTQWLTQVRSRNPGLAYDFSLRPVVSISVTFIDPEDEASSTRPFVDEARRWAARYG